MNALKWTLLGIFGVGTLGGLIWWLRHEDEDESKAIDPATCTEVATGSHRNIGYTIESCVGPTTGTTYYFAVLDRNLLNWPSGSMLEEPFRSPMGFVEQAMAVEWAHKEIDRRLGPATTMAPPPPPIVVGATPVNPVKQATIVGNLCKP